MAIEPADAHDRVLREAKVVGLGHRAVPTLEAVERRRVQVWALGMLTVVGVSAILLLGAIQAPSLAPWTANGSVQLLLVALVAGIAVYIVDRERRLRLLTRLLIDERALTGALVQRLSEVRTLLGVAKAMNSEAGLGVVLARITEAAATMLSADSGEVLITDGAVLRVVAASNGSNATLGDDHPLGADSGVAHAARMRELVSIPGTATEGPALHVPILHGSQLLGILGVTGGRERVFGDYDTRLALMFAEQAAFAIAATHKAEAAKWAEAERVEVTSQRGQLVAGAVSDLRDPLSSMIAATKMLKKDRLADSQRLELAEVLTRQTIRLAKSLEGILANQG